MSVFLLQLAATVATAAAAVAAFYDHGLFSVKVVRKVIKEYGRIRGRPLPFRHSPSRHLVITRSSGTRGDITALTQNRVSIVTNNGRTRCTLVAFLQHT